MSRAGGKTARVTVMLNMKPNVSREVLRGIAGYVARQPNWDCNLTSVESPNMDTAQRLRAADGVIIQIDNPRTALAVQRSKTPAVNVGAMLVPGVCAVHGNPQGMGELAARHLHDRGFRRFGYFANYGLWGSRIRGEAFKQAVEAMGCACDWFQLVEGAHRSWRKERGQIKRWLRRLKKPVALFTVGDPVARELAISCALAGFSVPRDVAILGVGNDELMCRMCRPELSSVHGGAREVGFEAARVLHRLMEGRKEPEVRSLNSPLQVVTRESTDIISVEEPRVSHAARAISEGLENGFSIKQLVKEMDISRRTLERAFREHLGRTIHDEIVRAQLQRVVQLLEEGTLRLSEVAARSGMRDTCRLSHFVKKHLGMTAWEYRRKHSRMQI